MMICVMFDALLLRFFGFMICTVGYGQIMNGEFECNNNSLLSYSVFGFMHVFRLSVASI